MEPWFIKWNYICAFSRTTTVVRVTKSQFDKGRQWAWRQYVLQTYSDVEMAWGQYELEHSRNTHRLPLDLFQRQWQAARERWASLSTRDPDNHRITGSDNGQVVHEEWGPREIQQRHRNLLLSTRKTATREYRSRMQDRMLANELLLNAEVFGSNRAQDAFRAIMLRDGNSIVKDGEGGWTRKGSRKHARLYYDTPAAVPRPSKHLDFSLEDGCRPYEWIILGDDGYTTTAVDPGSEVPQRTHAHTKHTTTRTLHNTTSHNARVLFAGHWTVLRSVGTSAALFSRLCCA
jgi:hypothetical protein